MDTLKQQISDPPFVVVVDDDKGVRTGLCNLLRSAGYRAGSYATAETFLDTIDTQPTDCLILDFQLEGMTGAELYERLRERRMDFPIILVSGHVDLSEYSQQAGSGHTVFLHKPIDADALLRHVDRFIHVSRPAR